MYKYTLHVCDGRVAESAGTRLLIRLGNNALSILAALINSTELVRMTADSLQRMNEEYNCNIRKNSTKSAKIRELLKVKEVLEQTTAEERDRVERILQEMDEKRTKKQGQKNTDAEAGQDADEAAGINYQKHTPVHACLCAPTSSLPTLSPCTCKIHLQDLLFLSIDLYKALY